MKTDIIMTDTTKPLAPDWVALPGETIGEIMAEVGWKQSDLAESLGYSEKQLSQLINGEATITHEVAQRLDHVLGGSVTFWLNLETNYQQHKTRIEAQTRCNDWGEADRMSPPKDQSSPSSHSVPQATQKGAAALKSVLTQGVAMVEESSKNPKDAFIHWSRLNDLNSKYSASDDPHIVQSFKVIREFQQAGSLPALTEMYRRNQEFITRMKDENPDIYTDIIAAGKSCRWILENGLKILSLDEEYSNRN